MINVTCKICHKSQSVNANNSALYDLPVVIDNFVCYLCSQKIKLVKLSLTCDKCKSVFCTKVLESNRSNYNSWVCPTCVSNTIKKSIIKGANLSELKCSVCFQKDGVCNHPELPCSLASKFVPFINSGLYSVKNSKDCSILSISEVDNKRTDIHAFKYKPLHKTNYLIATNNLVLLRQRVNSKKNFVTKVILYGYKDKWYEMFCHNYVKGENWVVGVLEFINANCKSVTSGSL